MLGVRGFGVLGFKGFEVFGAFGLQVFRALKLWGLWCVVCPHRFSRSVFIVNDGDRWFSDANRWPCERRKSLQRPLLSMAGKNGIFISAQRRTCGQDGGVAGVGQALHPCYNGGTGRRSRQRPGGAHRVLLRQVEVTTKIIGIPMRKCRNCVKSLSGTRMHTRSRGCSADLQVKKAGSKKMDQQKKELQKQLRDLEKLTKMPEDIQSRLKEEWQQELPDIEPEHQKDAEEISKVVEFARQKEGMPKGCWQMQWRHGADRRRDKLQELEQKSQRIYLAEADLDEEIRNLQAGEERRNSCASRSNGCCFDSTVVEQLFTFGSSTSMASDPSS